MLKNRKEIESYTITILYAIVSICVILYAGNVLFTTTYNYLYESSNVYTLKTILITITTISILLIGSIAYVHNAIKKIVNIYADEYIPVKSYWYHKDNDISPYMVISTFKLTLPIKLDGNLLYMELVVYINGDKKYFVRTREHFLDAFHNEDTQRNIEVINTDTLLVRGLKKVLLLLRIIN